MRNRPVHAFVEFHQLRRNTDSLLGREQGDHRLPLATHLVNDVDQPVLQIVQVVRQQPRDDFLLLVLVGHPDGRVHQLVDHLVFTKCLNGKRPHPLAQQPPLHSPFLILGFRRHVAGFLLLDNVGGFHVNGTHHQIAAAGQPHFFQFVQHVALQVTHFGRHLVTRRDVQFDLHRHVQVSQDIHRGVGKRVQLVLRQVEAPDMLAGKNPVERQPDAQAQDHRAGEGTARRRPAADFQQQPVQEQEDSRPDHEIQDVADGHDAARERVVVPGEADHVGKEHAEPRPGAVNESSQELRAEEKEAEAGQQRYHERNDLVAAKTRDEQAQRQEERAQQYGAEVRRGDRAEIGISEPRQHPRNRQSSRQSDDEENQTGKEFAKHQFVRPHRKGEQQFPRVLFALFRPDAHGHRRQENTHDERQGVEETAHVSHQQREERRHEQSDAEQQKDDHEDVANGRTVIRSQFPTKNGAEIAHVLFVLQWSRYRPAAPSLGAVRARNVSSRVPACGDRIPTCQPLARTSSVTCCHN